MTCDDAAARVHLIGGEMLEWSDAAGAGADGAGVLGELLHPLLPGGARVLVAGPHPAGLFEDPAVAACEPSVLVRSYSDACRLAGHHELTVHCGSLEKAAFPGAFDVVVALDGVGRLTSFDHAGGTWAESLERLTGMLAPGGTLVLGAENPLGLHRLAGDPHEVHRRADDDWAAAELDGSRPVSLEQLTGLLTAAGLTVGRSYAAYGRPYGPHLLMDVPVLEAASAPAALTVAACAGAFGAPAAGHDPRHLARAVMAGGLGAQVAARWVVAAHADGARPAALPVALTVDAGAAPYWRLPCELAPAAQGGWTRRARGDRTLRVSGRVTRTPGLLDGPVPEGRSLAEILMTACARNDVVAVREVLGLFLRWLEGHGGDGRMPGWTAFAVADNVVFDGARFAMLDASWQLPGELDAGAVVARIMRHFAARLLESGQWHPWSWQLGADRLTLTLLAMAGATAGEETVRRGAELEVEIAADLGAAPQDGPREEAGRDGKEDGPGGDGPGERWEGYRELYAARGRLSARLEEAQQKITMLERDLEAAEARLAKAVRAVKQARRRDKRPRPSGGSRLGRVITAPAAALRPVRRMFGAGPGGNAAR
ncbi:hypothetical protein [Streptosporangium sp. NPDC003464]